MCFMYGTYFTHACLLVDRPAPLLDQAGRGGGVLHSDILTQVI